MKTIMKYVVRSLFLSVLTFGLAEAASAAEIVIPESPTAMEKNAADELTHYLVLTAETLEINGQPVSFQIGDTPFARSNGVTVADMPEESWQIKSFGPVVVIAGGGHRGTLYGVYHFIEDQLGVRWWSDTEEYVPPKRRFSFDKLEMSGKPAFAYRNIYQTGIPNGGWRFAVRNRLNQLGDIKIPEEYGGQVSFGSPAHVHAIGHGYLPVDTYLATNPKYYALVNGERRGSMTQGQPCLSNPDLVPLFITKLKAYILADEAAAKKSGMAPPQLYDISINDNMNYCQCESCTAIAKEHGNSGVLLLFINQIARSLKEFRPNLQIQTAAYYAFLDVPRDVVLEDNIVLRVINTVSNNAFDIQDSRNLKFHDTLINWSKICKKIIVWDYSINFESSAGLPYPSEFNYGTNLKFYLQNGVIGMLVEHEYPEISDMFELKTWLEAKLFEDPGQDANRLIDEFFRLYYGPAAKAVLAYRQLLKQATKENNCSMRGFSPPPYVFTYIDWNTMQAAQNQMDDAESAVKDKPELFQRVRRARLGIDLAIVKLNSFYHSKIQSSDAVSTLEKLTVSARERLLGTLTANCKLFMANEQSLAKLNYFKALANMNPGNALPPPNVISNALFLDASCWTPHSQNVSLVTDADAFGGIALRFDADAAPKYYQSLKQSIGLYDLSTGKEVKTVVATPKSAGYNWYALGPVKVNPNMYLYVTNSWEGQYYPLAEIDTFPEQEITYYIQMKFEGPFFNFSGDKNAIRVGGIIIVPRRKW